MRTLLPVLLVTLLAAGCQPKPKTSAAPAGPGPQAIAELTIQTLVYECPQCGMDFDRPGQCTMDHVDLVPTRIDYICPADNQPVVQAGKCPRCQANATIRRTALATPPQKALTGN